VCDLRTSEIEQLRRRCCPRTNDEQLTQQLHGSNKNAISRKQCKRGPKSLKGPQLPSSHRTLPNLMYTIRVKSHASQHSYRQRDNRSVACSRHPIRCNLTRMQSSSRNATSADSSTLWSCDVSSQESSHRIAFSFVDTRSKAHQSAILALLVFLLLVLNWSVSAWEGSDRWQGVSWAVEMLRSCCLGC